ncbi:hypothetical protein BUALT_Bualt06G0129300 [Buddleja alternifolia]|uniref:Protein kinase domain-containing protein n=1 Tax=Buddleja alternifolia TaxID=168488 RepID=A0AAV6XR56_9LAMI|nr:hypothetical protein BUALT_Bualt06G0129300 [Buddleja alternifolia]
MSSWPQNLLERLVTAVLRKEQFRELSRTPSILSSTSASSSFDDVDSSNAESSLTYLQQLEEAVANSPKLHPKLVFISDFSPAFDVEGELLVSAELLGSGTFGSVYTAVMDNGVRIAVKRLNSGSISEQKFKRHMDIVGNVKHDNVVPLRAYYSSSDEKLMLYDYYSDGSVYELLYECPFDHLSFPRFNQHDDHQRVGERVIYNDLMHLLMCLGQIGANLAHVDWGTRLRIAIGAARGISEIHSQNDGKLVHGNIKSSNIFLNEQHYGCVSDLGLTNIIETTFMPTARCYAPEVKSTQNLSQESDVYSFGILLLELLTGKSPVHVNLVKFVNSIKSRVRTSTVFHVDLLKYPGIRKEMEKVLKIGRSCIAKSIKKRPKMYEVVNMLESLGKMNTGSSVSLERKLVFVKDSNATFELKDMLRDSAEVLGRGTFGSSYKAVLGNRDITITMKRSKDVNVAFEEFQQHMEVIGRMRHENVADLKAYYFSGEEVLLVYDYYDEDSLYALLHGTERTPLDWETRLKIAIGAARGISHIHRQDGRKLVHGNIKSSNIFLNQHQYGLVSDAGLAKVMKPLRRAVMQTPNYFAPEIKDTRKTSQASDVYSFGVVLLELVSGKPSQDTTEEGEVISLAEWVHSVISDDWTAKVFDIELMRYQSDEEAMTRFLHIAMDCINFVPEYRPKMSEVVKMLEGISGVDTRGPPSIESRLEVLLPTLTLQMVVAELD